MKKIICGLLLAVGIVTLKAYATGPFIGTVQLNPPVAQSGGFNVSTGTINQSLTLPYLSGNQCLQVNAGVVSGSGALCSASSGGGQSTLGVFGNGVQVSSPTAQINFLAPILTSLKGSATAQVSVDCSSVTCEGQIAAILNQNTLQASSTAYPNYLYVGSTASVIGAFSAGSYSGSGAGLSSLNASNITSGVIGTTYLPSAGIIFSTNTLQVGTTFYVSSGSVAGQFNLPSLSGVLYDSVGTVTGGATTTNLPEGANLYFTTVRATGSITATSPLSNTSGNISETQAGASLSGWLSSADWIRFNNGISGSNILNQNTLQSGSTAYPQYLYVGSSGTVSGTLSATTFSGSGSSLTGVILNQNTLQSATTAYPQYLYVGSSESVPTSSITSLFLPSTSDKGILFNNGGVIASSAAFTWDHLNNKLLLTTTLSGDSFPVFETSGTIKMNCADSGPLSGFGLVGITCRNNSGENWSTGPALVFRNHSTIFEREDNSWQLGMSGAGSVWVGDSLSNGVSHPSYSPLATFEVFGNASIGNVSGFAGKGTPPSNGLIVGGAVIVTTTTQIGQMTVGSPTTGTVPALALIQGAGQTGDLLDFYNSSKVLVANVTNAGVIGANGSALTSLNGSQVLSGTVGTTYLPSGTQGILYSTNTLQSGTTAYPQYIYAGSTGSITGAFSAGTYFGGSLATCGDGTHALNWASGAFGCQTLTSGSGSSIYPATSTILANSGITDNGQTVLFSTGTLQAGTTAYPQFLYVGSSATITGALSINGTNPILSQNTLQSGTTAYPQFIYVGSSATISNLSVSTISGASFEAYRRPEIMSYAIGTSSAVAISTYTPNGIDGILNQVTAWFPNGVIQSTNTLTPATILWATGTYSCSGTIQGGMAPGEQVATGAKYRIYAVLCPNLVDWTIAASTNDAIQANRATLNTLFGYRRYFPLGLEFNGVQNTNNGNTGGGFVPFYQSGNKTCFLNSSNPIENSGTIARGVAVTTGTASGTSLTYTPTSGMTGTSMPPTLGYITWTAINGVGSTNSWTVYDSNQRFTYWSQVGNTGGSGTVNVEGPAFSGLKVVNTAGSAGIDFFIGCFTDTALTGPFGSSQ